MDLKRFRRRFCRIVEKVTREPAEPTFCDRYFDVDEPEPCQDRAIDLAVADYMVTGRFAPDFGVLCDLTPVEQLT